MVAVMTTQLERDFVNLATRQAPPASPFEPVAVAALYPAPLAATDSDQSKGWIRRVLPVLLVRKWAFTIAMVAALIAMAAQIITPRVLMTGIDRALATRGGDALAPYVWGLIALGLVRGLFTWVHRNHLFRFAFDLESDLRLLMYAHLGRLSFGFYDRAPSGELISRANTDIRAVQVFLTFAPLLALNLVGLALAFGLMLEVHVALTLVALAPLPGVFLAALRMRHLLYPVSWIVQARQAELASIVSENVTGVRVVRAFAAEQQQVDTLARSARRLRWAAVKQLVVRATYAPAIENLPRLGMALVLGYGGALALRGQVTVGVIVAFSSYVAMLQAPFRMLGGVIMQGRRAAASADRIFELLDTVPAIRDRHDAVDLTQVGGELHLQGVHFGYTQHHDVLRGFDLHVAAGESVALVGRTGCGKSTVARLLARFYDVDAGHVLIDGRDVREVTQASLRAHVVVAPDEPFLFAGTIRDNIAYGRPDADHAAVEAAARAAQAHEFIAQLPDGYDTEIGERGYTLSGGQRQRVALARVLLVAPPVLVLDDATSAVDARVEAQIHRALRTLTADRTTVIIAHRISTIALADRVVLIEDGQVAATGTHAELLATHPGYAAVLATLDDRQAMDDRQTMDDWQAMPGGAPR
jgi:ATP-binding cassette subfamily B protein